MKNFWKSLMMSVLLGTLASPGYAQVAPENRITLRGASDASILVGAGSTDSKVGPSFSGALGYGIGSGVTLFVESGYGWTNYQSVDGRKLVQIPVLGGLTYNFGQLINTDRVQPYVGASAGIFNSLYQQDGSTVSVSGNELKTTNFGLEGLAGVSVRLTEDVALDVRGSFDHIFSKRDNGNLLESQEWSDAGIGGGISYNFSF